MGVLQPFEGFGSTELGELKRSENLDFWSPVVGDNGVSNTKGGDMEKIELETSERQPCEVWTRVMGYHRPVQSFNIGKKGEFEERKYFSEAKSTQEKAKK